MMTVSGSWRSIHQELVLFNAFKVYVLVNAAFDFEVPLSVLEERSCGDIELPVLVEEVLGGSRLSIMGARNE